MYTPSSDPEALLSVGIDIGTTTTQLIFSRLVLKNQASDFAVPDISIAEKQVLFRSHIHFTPLLDERTIDAEAVRRIVAEEYARAGMDKAAVQTGAVIITGETARKENARQVLSALSEFAGDFVVATAGPALESVLSGKGSGAADYSRQHHCPVLNFDIGGGTSNLALFDDGEVADTGCLNVGGRLIKLSPEHVITYISPVLEGLTALSTGQTVGREALLPVVKLLCGVLTQAAGLAPQTPLLERFITDKMICLGQRTPVLSFSGGVADVMGSAPPDWDAYGDIGVLLGQAIAASALMKAPHITGTETIRATVVGAGSHSTQLSGSTIHFHDAAFPMKNLPVLSVTEAEERSPTLSQILRQRLQWFQAEGGGTQVVLALRGEPNPRFSRICQLADAIAEGFSAQLAAGYGLLIAVRHDMAKALGQALSYQLPAHTPVVCLDGICLRTGAYLDIGMPAMHGSVLPVVVKTLILT